jgi:hypothetical protein
MATPDQYSIKLNVELLEGTVTITAPAPSVASLGSITESFYATLSLAGGASDTNLKLGTLTDPKFLALFSSGTGVSFKTASGGTSLPAYPCAFLAETVDGLGVSEVWLSNSNGSARTVNVLAAE